MLEGFEFTHNYLTNLDFRVVIAKDDLPFVNSVTPGGLIVCMDDRYEVDEQLAGAAYPGGFTGLRTVIDGASAEERAQNAFDRANNLGFVLTTHGDMERGAYLGCALRYGLVDRMLLQDFPPTTVEEMAQLTRKHNIQNLLLEGVHRADKILINLRPYQTVKPEGEFFVIDQWLADQMGIDREISLKLIVNCARLVLPLNNRIILAA